MATTTAATATEIQTLYVAYFNRPADPLGLQLWLNSGASIQTIANGFSGSDEYKATYAGKTNLDLVDSIYMNLFGRHAEAAGLLFWAGRLQAGTDTFASIVLTIASNAQDDGTNNDLTAINSKVAAATAFTGSLDTAADIRGYDGASANAVVKAWLAGVTNAATLATATTAAALQATADAATAAHDNTVNNPQTLSLTTGVDTIVGGAGNDIINASNSGASTTWTGLDSIDGGAGKDTLNINDVAGGVDLSLATVKNVEIANITSTGALAGNAANVSGWTGLTNATFNLKAAAVQSITAADTTAVTVTNTAGVTVVGGSSITVNAGTGAAVTSALNTLSAAITATSLDADIAAALTTAVNAGAITAAQRTALETAYGYPNGAGVSPTAGEVTAGQNAITGYIATVAANSAVVATSNDALASATIKGGSTVTITDGSDNSDQLKSVSLDGNSGLATLTGKALTAVTVANTSQSTTINNSTASHAETVTVTNVKGGTIQDAAATTLNVVTATTKSTGLTFSAAAATKVNVAAAVDLSATFTAAAATSVAVSGAGKVTIAGATLDAAAVIDASANTGGVIVTPTLLAGQNFIGGAGKDSITIGATTKSINLGAGDDTVTLTGSLGLNGKVDGGAGNDTIAGTAAVMAALTATDAAGLVNFETYKVTTALQNNTTFDVSQIAGLVNFVAGAGVADSATANAIGLGANANVSILGAASSTSTGVLSVALKTDTAADVINLTLNHNVTVDDNGAVNQVAANSSLTATGIETINVVSTATPSIAVADLVNGKADVITNVLTIADTSLTTLKISGDTSLSFIANANQTKLATIDASANTAGVTIDASADTIALTIKGTVKADTIISGTQGDTLTGGGGNDTFSFGAGSSSIGTGKFDTITDFVANTYGNAQTAGVDTGAAGTGANGSAAKWTGDVLSFAHAGTGAVAFKVDVLTSAADATTYLANNKNANGVVAALDSSNSNLYVDNTGDGVADFYIHLTGVTTINAAAFVIV